MNKKGFTLVEILIVIVLLGIIMTLAIPAVMDSKNGAINVLGDQEKKNIIDAAKLLAMDLDDMDSDIYNCKANSWIVTETTCEKQNSQWTRVSLTVENLENHNYFEDRANHCEGTVTIEYNNGKYNVTLSDDTHCS